MPSESAILEESNQIALTGSANVVELKELNPPGGWYHLYRQKDDFKSSLEWDGSKGKLYLKIAGLENLTLHYNVTMSATFDALDNNGQVIKDDVRMDFLTIGPPDEQDQWKTIKEYSIPHGAKKFRNMNIFVWTNRV